MRGSREQEVTTDRPASQRAALVAATLASFLTPFMASALNVALPSIGQEYSMDAVLLGWVATSFLLAAAMFLVPFGRIADIHGRKKVFTLGTAVFTAASLLAGLAPSATVLICARALQGIGSAMIFGTGVAILTSVFPGEERGRVLGINVAAATNESLIYAGSPVVQGRRVGTSFNYGPLGGFFNLDVSLGYKFGKYLTLSGQAVNVLNAEVREFIGSPAIAPLYSVEVKVDLPAFATKR